MRMLTWRRTDGAEGLSMARVAAIEHGWRYQGSELLVGQEASSCTFAIDVDREHRPRRVIVRTLSDRGSRVVELTAEGTRWSVDGRHAPVLDGATDVDVAATPLTNTIPIRRIGHLAVGEQAVLDVVWIDVPSLAVHAMQQTYTRLEQIDGLDAWRYEAAGHGGSVVTVDRDGLVVDYEGFATRIQALPTA